MLRDLGHAAWDLNDLNMLSAKNGEVGKVAINQNAILVTLDKDFLQMKKEIKDQIRVIYIHVHPPNPFEIEKNLKANLGYCISKCDGLAWLLWNQRTDVFQSKLIYSDYVVYQVVDRERRGGRPRDHLDPSACKPL